MFVAQLKSQSQVIFDLRKNQEVIEMKTSVFSVLIVLTLLIAGPLAFSGQDQAKEEVIERTETITETSEPSNISEVIESIAAETKEKCFNSKDDNFDEKIDCEDTDCVKDPGCTVGY